MVISKNIIPFLNAICKLIPNILQDNLKRHTRSFYCGVWQWTAAENHDCFMKIKSFYVCHPHLQKRRKHVKNSENQTSNEIMNQIR